MENGGPRAPAPDTQDPISIISHYQKLVFIIKIMYSIIFQYFPLFPIIKIMENWIRILEPEIPRGPPLDEQKAEHLLKFIYDYQRLSIEKTDLQKRKRVKNIVPIFERCRAKRANGEQCTRRKKTSHQLCGTHIKGTPHGMIQLSEKVDEMKKISIWAQDIKGIIYYIDENHHVYDPKDIYENKNNPRIIAKWEKNEEGEADTRKIHHLCLRSRRKTRPKRCDTFASGTQICCYGERAE